MGHEIRLNGIVEESIVDGPGLRFTVFMQGCPHRCAGCHNPGTHDPDGGYGDDTERIFAQFMENPLLSGMTLSGGEPFFQAEASCALAEKVKKAGKNLVVYTGYLCESLARKEDRAVRRLLETVDILIDGPYVRELRNLELEHRGSSNQRILTRSAVQEMLRPAFAPFKIENTQAAYARSASAHPGGRLYNSLRLR
ncbi:MAG: anaerobic ribonucleoside-triphosphate reductase activating protein [Desulfovibrio sp.]|jgi:anaerobic ribonucleoside-triphosphate reductase activating protein|nr:anaerobic ribonucleoside-triphosphate reductase activating protein [Desulfovibrio sp.]